MMFLEFLYPKPRVCPLCQKPMPQREFCPSCLALITKSRPVCSICGRILPLDIKLCSDCRKELFSFTRASALLPYIGPVKKTMALFKYKNKRYVWDELYDGLAEHCLEKLGGEFDFIVPVPLNPHKLKERGYNQAEVLGKNLARRLKIGLAKDILIKTKNTPPQVRLGYKARRSNLKGSFAVNGNFAGGRILLVDDVFTTGATVEECTRELLGAGIDKVYVITLATAVKK